MGDHKKFDMRADEVFRIVNEYLTLGTDGLPVFKKPHRGKPVGHPALRTRINGSLKGNIEGQVITCPVAVWILTYGEIPEGKIMAVKGRVDDDCRASNLRTSLGRYIHYDNTRKHYAVCYRGKRVGSRPTLEEAIEFRDQYYADADA